ncbi:curli production assembly/transport component CsgF [Rhodohalobacter sulfatireducens]|uniref:Curli production assembly/transport component CsgF n=1 Tax=Rhodohalobacter sulfatireducens TaxID=2911366 RepID=A0ABS9KJ82_9BACT|nr:curli production assembly/transport component CsgF [Rhodohalobacter sulfatireducens]MCG2590919.1 curli assembly protein CsgF [Rhodohalobacter sulfatireducens]
MNVTQKSILLLLPVLFGLFTSAFTQDLVYRPKNPAFGGSPANFSWLINSANTQNLFTEERSSPFNRDPLADFESSLKRQVLSQLTRDVVLSQFGEGSVEESRFEFGEFTIDVTPGPDGVEIRIFNILTGDETSITIPNF